MTADPETLAAQLKAWRGKALSQRAAAERLGISKRTLEGIEQGRGFAYPSLLLLALRTIDPTKETQN